MTCRIICGALLAVACGGTSLEQDSPLLAAHTGNGGFAGSSGSGNGTGGSASSVGTAGHQNNPDGGPSGASGASGEAGTTAGGEAGNIAVVDSGITAGQGGETTDGGNAAGQGDGASGSSAGAAGAAEEDAGAPCACAAGICCDGCNLRPTIPTLGLHVYASHCTGAPHTTACSSQQTAIEQDIRILDCTGSSATDTVWLGTAAYKYIIAPCDNGQICIESGSNGDARCAPCPG